MTESCSITETIPLPALTRFGYKQLHGEKSLPMSGAKRVRKEPAVIAYLYSSTHHIMKPDLQATRVMYSHTVAASNVWTITTLIPICHPLIIVSANLSK